MGMGRAKIRLKKNRSKSVFYLMRLPIVVHLLHNVQAHTDSSNKVDPVSLTFQTKRRPNQLSFSEKSNGWQIKLRNRSTSLKLRNTVCIPEMILRSMFSQIFTSFSKQKRVNVLMAITPQRVILLTKRMVHFIAEGLLYPAVPISLF